MAEDDFDDDDFDDGEDEEGNDDDGFDAPEPVTDEGRPTNIYDAYAAEQKMKEERDKRPPILALKSSGLADKFLTIEDARASATNSALSNLAAGASSYYIKRPMRDRVKGEEKWWVRAARKSPLLNINYRPNFSEFPNGIVPDIHNVVATSNLGCQIDLRKVASKLPNCEFAPRQKNGMILRIRDPRATAILFPMGQLKCMGSKTEYLALLASRKFARKLERLGCPVKFRSFRVTIVTGSVDLRFRIRSLDAFAKEYESEGATYDPECFCGVRYEFTEPKLKLQVYASGRLVFLGAKSRADIYCAYKMVYPKLLKHRAIE